MTILVIDPNPADLNRLCACLENLWPETVVEKYLDPLLAYKYAFNNPVTAIYTVVNMRRANGFELAKMLKRKYPGIQVNYIVENQKQKEQAVRHLANSCIVKPVTPENLRLTLKEEES